MFLNCFMCMLRVSLIHRMEVFYKKSTRKKVSVLADKIVKCSLVDQRLVNFELDTCILGCFDLGLLQL